MYLSNSSWPRPLHGPLFSLELMLDHSDVHYSSHLPQFEAVLPTIFDRGILATHTVPQIEKVREWWGGGVEMEGKRGGK